MSATCSVGTPSTSLGYSDYTLLESINDEEAYLTCFSTSSSYGYVGLRTSSITYPYIICGPSDLPSLTAATSTSACGACAAPLSDLQCGQSSTVEYWAWNPLPSRSKVTLPQSASDPPACAFFSFTQTTDYSITLPNSVSDCTNYCSKLSSSPSYYGLVVSLSTPYCYCMSDTDAANLYAVNSSLECGSCAVNTFTDSTCGLSGMHGIAVYKLGSDLGGLGGSSSLSTGAIAGIAVGAIAVVAIAIAIAAFVVVSSRRRAAAAAETAKTVTMANVSVAPGGNSSVIPDTSAGTWSPADFSYPPETGGGPATAPAVPSGYLAVPQPGVTTEAQLAPVAPGRGISLPSYHTKAFPPLGDKKNQALDIKVVPVPGVESDQAQAAGGFQSAAGNASYVGGGRLFPSQRIQ